MCLVLYIYFYFLFKTMYLYNYLHFQTLFLVNWISICKKKYLCMSIMVNAKFETYLPQSIWCYLPPSNYGFRAVKLNLYFCIMSELKKNYILVIGLAQSCCTIYYNIFSSSEHRTRSAMRNGFSSAGSGCTITLIRGGAPPPPKQLARKKEKSFAANTPASAKLYFFRILVEAQVYFSPNQTRLRGTKMFY